MEASLPELWDDDRLCAYLGVGSRFVARICSEKRIRYLRVGGRRRFDPADVAEYVEASKRGGPERRATKRGVGGRPLNSMRKAG